MVGGETYVRGEVNASAALELVADANEEVGDARVRVPALLVRL